MKARRIGLDQERVEHSPTSVTDEPSHPSRWQFIGINELVPLPVEHSDGLEIGTLDLTTQRLPLEDLFRACPKDYSIEAAFDEERGGTHYRAILDPSESGF